MFQDQGCVPAHASVYISCCLITLMIPRLRIKFWPYHLYRQNAGNVKEKYEVLALSWYEHRLFMKDSGTEHWRRDQSSVCYSRCHGSQKCKRCWWSPSNVKDADRALAVSNGCYGTLALSEMRLELWLCQKWGWHSEYISVCLWYLAILKTVRNRHLAFSKLGVEPWLCQYLS